MTNGVVCIVKASRDSRPHWLLNGGCLIQFFFGLISFLFAVFSEGEWVPYVGLKREKTVVFAAEAQSSSTYTLQLGWSGDTQVAQGKPGALPGLAQEQLPVHI